MKNQFTTRSILFCAVFSLVAALTWASPGPVPEQVFPGSAFVVYVPSARPTVAMDVTLLSPKGEVVEHAPAFKLNLMRDVSVWVACLAIDSTYPQGTYRVISTLHPESSAAADIVVKSTLLVADRTFAHDRIRLNAALTELRANPDSRKIAEAKMLLSIIARHDSGAQYLFSALAMPVQGAIVTSRFGDRRTFLYSNGEGVPAIHYGIDLALPTGSPIFSDGAGKVVFSGALIETGNTVVVEHLPGVYSLYYHMHTINVQTGERVDTGQQIGSVGMTGLATGPHLHWEVRVNGIPVDPLSLLSAPLIDKAHILATMMPSAVSSGTSTKEGR